MVFILPVESLVCLVSSSKISSKMKVCNRFTTKKVVDLFLVSDIPYSSSNNNIIPCINLI